MAKKKKDPIGITKGVDLLKQSAPRAEMPFMTWIHLTEKNRPRTSHIRSGTRKMTKRTTAILIELIPIISVISALLLLNRDTDSPFLRIVTAVVFIFAFFGFAAFFLGRKLAREDKTVKILGVMDWTATAIIVGIYALAFFVMAIW